MTARRSRRALPGFRIALAWTLFWLGLVILVPLGTLVWNAGVQGLDAVIAAVSSARVAAAFALTFGAALLAAIVNVVFGGLLAWVLTRQQFPGRGVLDALVDLPIALPTAVAGIALTALYVPDGPIGRVLAMAGIEVAYTRAGVLVAMIFVGLPFVVRTVEPVILDLARDEEQAAATLGATRAQTFLRVTLPALAPALAAGFALALARAIGEYGSVIFIAGNVPHLSEIVPLVIVTRLEQYDYAGATAIATVLLAASLALLVAVNAIESRWRRGYA